MLRHLSIGGSSFEAVSVLDVSACNEQQSDPEASDGAKERGWQAQLDHREPGSWCVGTKPYDRPCDGADSSSNDRAQHDRPRNGRQCPDRPTQRFHCFTIGASRG